MNTLHHHDNEYESPAEFKSPANKTRRLKLAATALLFAVPTGMYADDAINAVQESFELHIDPAVLEGLPAK